MKLLAKQSWARAGPDYIVLGCDWGSIQFDNVHNWKESLHLRLFKKELRLQCYQSKEACFSCRKDPVRLYLQKG